MEEEEEEEVVEVEVEVEDVEVVEESSVIFCRLLDVSSSSAPLFMVIEFVQILIDYFRVSTQSNQSADIPTNKNKDASYLETIPAHGSNYILFSVSLNHYYNLHNNITTKSSQ